MRLFVISLAAVIGWGQERALMPAGQALEHYSRILQLMESTTATMPGLARAGAPVMENAKQSLKTLRGAASTQDGGFHYEFLTNVRAYLALAEAMPKPFPFPAEGRKQFAELRDALERADSHFRALLEAKEAQLRAPDRDNLRRYETSNSRLTAPVSGKPRVVFLGDSITDGWRLNEYFPEKDYVNRGIGGQITGQMLGRMLADVVRPKPAAMLVLAGTNDIARGVSPEAIEGNLTMIADLAAAYKIKPVFASILPVHDYNKEQNPAYEMTKRRPMETIKVVNDWLLAFCKTRGYVYLDYFSAMLDERGMLKQELANDGLHPNAAGYKVMAPLAEAAIDKVARPEVPKKKGFFERKKAERQ